MNSWIPFIQSETLFQPILLHAVVYTIQLFTGGWAEGRCPNGILYAQRYKLRAEGASDFFDMWRSMEHMPALNIIDFPTQWVKYANKRVRNFIAPNDCFLAALDEAQLALAQAGTLHSVLRNLYQEDNNMKYFHSRYLITGTRNKVVLVDNFHEINSKEIWHIKTACRCSPDWWKVQHWGSRTRKQHLQMKNTLSELNECNKLYFLLQILHRTQEPENQWKNKKTSKQSFE